MQFPSFFEKMHILSLMKNAFPLIVIKGNAFSLRSKRQRMIYPKNVVKSSVRGRPSCRKLAGVVHPIERNSIAIWLMS